MVKITVSFELVLFDSVLNFDKLMLSLFLVGVTRGERLIFYTNVESGILPCGPWTR